MNLGRRARLQTRLDQPRRQGFVSARAAALPELADFDGTARGRAPSVRDRALGHLDV
ncbi:MAG: hypothetical protein MZW92_51170 [Comamonadaceae bacterium]|nr:hypothetical protein [Comamonadaceae bacterium]